MTDAQCSELVVRLCDEVRRRVAQHTEAERKAFGARLSDCTPEERLVRRWCHDLLDAAEADGLGGCQLCQS